MVKKYKAILFDFDGVIGKTMEDNYRAWEYAFSKYSIKIDKTEYFLLEGMYNGPQNSDSYIYYSLG